MDRLSIEKIEEFEQVFLEWFSFTDDFIFIIKSGWIQLDTYKEFHFMCIIISSA